MAIKTIKISNDCEAIKYVSRMGMSAQGKRATNVALERKKKYDWGLYKNGRNIFVRIGNNAAFRIEVVGEKIPVLDLKLGLNYLLNHNGTTGLNMLCFSENCILKNSHKCTMKLLQKL